MEQVISVEEKRKFINWLLFRYEMKRKEIKWILNYIKGNEKNIGKSSFYRRSSLLSALDGNFHN